MRTRLFTFLAMVVATSIGCGDNRSHDDGDNEIVFGITQKTIGGKTTTSADWEMLSLGTHGWSTIGYVDQSRACWLETLSSRLGQPHVDVGVASFFGGMLPGGGLTIVANANANANPNGGSAGSSDDGQVSLDGPGWASGDLLTFSSQGFAIPDVSTSVRAPSTDLAITSPADGAVTVGRASDFVVTWDPTLADDDQAADHVMVALTTDDKTSPVEVRCFFARQAGQGNVPADLLTQLPGAPGAPGAPAKGTLRFATHRQRDVFAPGGWHVYVVAGVIQREQSFATLP